MGGKVTTIRIPQEQGQERVYYALDVNVVVVAVYSPKVGDWTAYVGAVAGENHEREWEGVARHGSKLSPKVAAVLFPGLAEQYQWRD